MIFASKADTLVNLKNLKLNFSLPKTYVFSVNEWQKNKKNILNKINLEFKTKIAIRSSSYNEDLVTSSQAGKYLSKLNIDPKKLKNVKKAISLVIGSYKSKHLQNKVIIQNQITKVSMSGVIFTHDLVNGTPYYVINYDDKSKKTDTVTSGTGKNSNKKLIIYRHGVKSLKSERFKKLIYAVQDLEKKINDKYLDLEFVVDSKLRIYLLQARKISTIKKKILNDNFFREKLAKDKKKLLKFFKKNKDITVLGQMPDWNPAEIIGKNPKKLSFSIYSKLITDSNWSKAREMMGYNRLSSKKLMFSFSGKPFIDVRKSFLSFIPKNLNNKLKEKIANHWVKQLISKPYLHDKIEFEIAITNYCFDIEKKIKKFLPKNIRLKDVKSFKNNHILQLTNFFDKDKPYSLMNIKKKIDKLIQKQKKFKLFQNKKKNIKLLNSIIFDCCNYGIIPFAQAARHGFVAKSLLDSIVQKKVLSDRRANHMKKSLQTITSEFLEDMSQVTLQKLSKEKFMRKYGHLRPGTYDINSDNYKKMKNFEFKRIRKNKVVFRLSDYERKKLNLLIKKSKIKINIGELFDYISQSTKLREYTKFVFTKTIDHIFKIIEKISPKNMSKDKIAYFSLEEIKQGNVNLSTYKLRKKNYNQNSSIVLPEIIKDEKSYDVIPYMFNVPNFITNLKINGKIIFISNNFSGDIENKIVLIENADPGFDWIFTRKIKGLVTQYGGANSHMAIRTAELNIPSVIGCGQKKFEELKLCNEVEINSQNKKIEILN